MKKAVWYLSCAAMALSGLAFGALGAVFVIASWFGYGPSPIGANVMSIVFFIMMIFFVWFWVAAYLTGGLMKPEDRGWK